MVEVRFRRLCAAAAFVLVCCGWLLASCTTPEFKFVDNANLPPHCGNQLPDEGESDLDCGGACMQCALGQRCNGVADCREGDCIDGTCQALTCKDEVQGESETDKDCGGGACKRCADGKGCIEGTDCQSGVCNDEICAAPSCGDRVANGSESDINCGGPDCAKCVAGQNCLVPSDCVGNECTAGKCVLSCALGRGNCDGDSSTDCETNLNTDKDHCGACGTACALEKATATCAGGMCRVESCNAPFADCDGNPTNGCEVNTNTNLDNCGACDAKPCPALNADAFCADAQCGFTCLDNFADCDGKPANGCERDVSRDISNCGGCGTVCTASAGKTAWCRKGQCGETTCAPGRGDCNGDPDDDAANGGCETDFKTSVDSCGACGSACVVPGGEPQCSSGMCSIKTCSPGFADCTGGYADGCETKTSTDLANCGACAKTCSTTNGSPVCVAGACQVKTCTGTFADCNGMGSDGCETNTATSSAHCGACTGSGVNCDAVFDNASGQCVNSVCTLKTCATGYSNCDTSVLNGCEANLQTDEVHCGACTTACSKAGATSNDCNSAKCTPTCSGTLLNCGVNPQNGCVIDGATDENNCGGCGKVCLNTNVDAAGNQCLAGKCNPSCANLFDDCDSKPENGCERSVAGDANNCGACGATCGTQNVVGTPTCGGGKCTSQCVAGWGSCGTAAAGCATPLGTLSNCSKCGEACTGTQLCSPGVGCVAHFDIGVVGTPISMKAGFESGMIPTSLSSAVPPTATNPNHTLTNSKASGRYRMVLVGVTATEPYKLTNPASIFAWYNNILMHPAIEVNTNEQGSYAGIFYLLDSELPANAGSYPVKVQFSFSAQNGSGAFTVSEFQNVQQTGSPPFVTTVASPSDANCGNPSARGVTLSFSQPGSFGYAVIAARAGTGAMASPGTVVETMNLIQNQPFPLAGLAGYVGPINGTSTPSWTVSNCPNSAAVGVVMKRVGD